MFIESAFFAILVLWALSFAYKPIVKYFKNKKNEVRYETPEGNYEGAI